jgi:peptidoglycan/xylan/chitin deacetylase (PgdA/CDA1 family)
MVCRCLIPFVFALAQVSAQEPAPAPVPLPVAPSVVPDAALPEEKPAIPDDATRVAILGYHDFSESQPETAMRLRTSKFRKQMQAIKQLGITVITLDDYLSWKRGEKTLPEHCMLLTLDDGWKSVYTEAFPILKEFGYPFTLYLYKNYVDGGGKALTTPMIQEMMKSGATIGSHSVTHPFPGDIKSRAKKGSDVLDAYLRNEMGESQRFLESKFPGKVTTFAYPGGFHIDEMYKLADEFHYAALFTVIPGKVKRSTPDKTTPRYMILGNYDKVFEIATSFREGGVAAPGSGVAGAPATTPVPVTPQAGEVVNSRLPLITADLTTIADLDPATLVMKVAGYGEVPAVFDAASHRLSWRVNRKLRQATCQVFVSWKDTKGKPYDIPLRWSFSIDKGAAYLPEDAQ